MSGIILSVAKMAQTTEHIREFREHFEEELDVVKKEHHSNDEYNRLMTELRDETHQLDKEFNDSKRRGISCPLEVREKAEVIRETLHELTDNRTPPEEEQSDWSHAAVDKVKDLWSDVVELEHKAEDVVLSAIGKTADFVKGD